MRSKRKEDGGGVGGGASYRRSEPREEWGVGEGGSVTKYSIALQSTALRYKVQHCVTKYIQAHQKETTRSRSVHSGFLSSVLL